jgi:hypothetical protein
MLRVITNFILSGLVIKAAQEYYTAHVVTSKDGTTIGYHQLRDGPGSTDYSVQKVAENMEAVPAKRDTHYVFGQ